MPAPKLFSIRPARIYFVLFSGRWFSAPGLAGPWVYATPNLPATFALIPADGPQADVLASVPGTAQAQEAVITAQIPQQTSLPKSSTTTVTYVGAPNFAPIAGTNMTYAVNTYAQVIGANGLYYACVNGAWYVSKHGHRAVAAGNQRAAGDLYHSAEQSALSGDLRADLFGNAQRRRGGLYCRLHDGNDQPGRRGGLRHRLLLSAGGDCRRGAVIFSVSLHLWRRHPLCFRQPAAG